MSHSIVATLKYSIVFTVAMLLAGFKRDYMESMEVEVSVYSIEYAVYI